MTLDLLKNMDPNDVQNDKLRGQIVVELTYKPFKEEDLPKDIENSSAVQKAPEGTPPGEGGEERKTKQIKKNRDPRWEEEFTFMLEEPPLKDKLHVEETLGYVDISLADVISNKRINEKFHLIDSKNGRIQIELQWQTS
ncbi:Synaptotagmin-2 [Sesamum angolense]|uniref:Synaptotagmin-2 n=1 Tax=Sesamum angolense TaxID=2727404 RepID=A0AAE1WY77_9LAMI|nr:Synaptotagmin-2 [Sesamum angolense]